MDTTRRASWARYAGEAVTIFAGVVLALAADDWRQTREERHEAKASLALLVDDLRGGSATFARFGRIMACHAGTAAGLIEEWDRPHEPPDSVEAALWVFAAGGIASFRRSALEGLRDTNRLRLIERDSVRSEINRYHQST